MKEKKYGVGVVVAVITPLKKDNKIDVESLKKIISHCIAGGVDGIFVLGTTGEGTCFTLEEKEEIISAAKELTGDGIPLYVGVMDSSTARVKENIKCAEANGADILVITPHYYMKSKDQEDIVRHIGSCARYASRPVMSYNIPQCTGVNIALDSVERILELDNVIGLKDSSGDWELFQKEIFLKRDKNFKLLQGAEELFGASMLMGADGCVTGAGNFAPGVLVEMLRESRKGDIGAVKELQYKVSRLRLTTFAGDFWVAGYKYACSLLGLCEEYVSLPFKPLSDSQKEMVKKILSEEGLLNFPSH